MMMRHYVRFSASLVAVAALAFCAAPSAHAQNPAPTTANGGYVSSDPLANVRYDNRYEMSLSPAYQHIKAGPNILQGANLGGLDLEATYWLSQHWALEGTGRSYLGTSGTAPNTLNIRGPFIQEHVFAAGPEWLGPHNKHGALIAHVLVGGAYGKFEGDLHGNSPAIVDFYNDQISPAVIVGGHIDLNRSARWVFRITPDALMTRYGINYGTKATQTDVNFGISVGVKYKFSKKW
jgi:hypothetical protein